MGSRFYAALRTVLPISARHWLRRHRQQATLWPPLDWVRFGSLRRLKPVSNVFGLDRGSAIDRYYIEHFLACHAADVKGRVLEIGDNTYTRRFGGERVVTSDVLHAAQGNPTATIVADLTCAEIIESDAFDCILITQTLQFIYDVQAALRTLHRILKPGGVVLATVPGISQISRYDMQRWGDYWRFTSASARRLFEEAFPGGGVSVETYGNVLVAVAFLHGLAAEELRRSELENRDPDYEVLITVCAKKQGVLA